jgi:hypothetical protein
MEMRGPELIQQILLNNNKLIRRHRKKGKRGEQGRLPAAAIWVAMIAASDPPTIITLCKLKSCLNCNTEPISSA